MKNIAVLITCHNRRQKTLSAIKSLFEAQRAGANRDLELKVYLTDDGSTDGTEEAVKELFPNVHLLKGDGNLFWAEGMRNSWEHALHKEYDAYLLLNDDVELYENAFDQLLATHEYSLKTFHKAGIYIGATEDKSLNKLTYSGSVIKNKFLYTQDRLLPNGKYQSCDLANANIMLVHRDVVDQIGILTAGYSHGIADYDYSLMASKKGIPVIVAPEYGGHCEYDHKDLYDGFREKSLRERKQYLYSRTGLAYRSYIRYMRKFFPLRYPLVVLAGWLKLYFPTVYLKYLKER